MKTITSIRIDTEILAKIKMYSEIEGKTQTDFLGELLEESLESYFLKRSGGMVLTIPNPQNFIVDLEKAKEVLSILASAADDIRRLNANIPVPLYGILAYLEQRLFYELPEDVEQFRKNLILDCTHGEEIAENKNSVGKE